MDSSLNELAGFNASNWRTVFRIGAVRYRIHREGVDAIQLAVKILRMAKARRSLLGLRGEIRAVRKTHCKAALIHLINVTKNEDLRAIAIWLRGQCGGYIGIDAIAKFSSSDSETMRCKVAGALQRMSGWSTLNQMSVNDPSPRVRRIASSRVPTAFRSRLSQFAKNFHPLPVHGARQRNLFVANHFELTPPKDTKSVEFIRAVLERIRVLVRGSIEVR